MDIKPPKPLWPTHRFVKRVARNFLFSSLIIFISLGIGMLGYRYFEKLSWVDAYLNAAMILSGMGEINDLKTVQGKIFAGSYALFSGIIFVIVMAILMAPLLHRFFHRFLIDETNKS